MTTGAELTWSGAVGEAVWIAQRLDGWEKFDVGSVIPRGFPAYARLLHPVESEGRLVRWRDVAAWSGLPLHVNAQFHSVALAPADIGTPRPWRGQGPVAGTLAVTDARALLEILAAHTTTDRCWFCLWDGYGWGDGVTFSAHHDGTDHEVGGDVGRADDPIPLEVRNGPRVHLPERDYLLYEGPIGTALAWCDTQDQTPNLWWPQDRSWCVASEIDLPWTYVAGSETLVTEILGRPHWLEALPATPDDEVGRVEDWVEHRAEAAVAELLATGSTTVDTGAGTYRAWVELPTKTSPTGTFRSRGDYLGGGNSSEGRLQDQDDQTLENQLTSHVLRGILSLVD